MPSFIQRLTRRKYVSFENTELPRVLTTFDLTLLGIGSTVGVGFYVLAGQVARSVAGPAVIVSFLIAAVASVFAGLCYAEFGARVPKAGSAYVYSYVCVGEFVAFVIGWNLVLEYVIGTASVARGYSGYIDGLANNTISRALEDVLPINVDFLSAYPDFLSFGLILLLSVLLSLGVKESSILNSVCTCITLVIVTYTIIALATQADGGNWALSPESLNETCPEEDSRHGWGKGGFAPYGFAGIMQGAATCFFGFVGFDCIATTGEEAIKPERSIPVSIGLSLFFVFVAYFGLATTITLALPYCQQDPNAPLVAIFNDLGWQTSKWIISIGALFGFSASLFGILLPLPRVIYAMANDGMLFRFLAKINKRFRTPAIATIVSGAFAALMAMFFNLDALVDMMSIGTLLAYTIVALSVMLLRYTEDDDAEPRSLLESEENWKNTNGTSAYSAKDYLCQLFNIKSLREPSDLSSTLVSYAIIVFCLISAILSMLLVVLQKQLSNGEVGAVVAVGVMTFLAFLNVVVIACQPQSKKQLAFKVPLVPWIPAVSSIVNLYLMFNLSSGTWIRFGIWMAIGFPLYFGYGIRHSTSGKPTKRGVRKHGIDNPLEANADKVFTIPTIEIHPATPASSIVNTPQLPARSCGAEDSASISDVDVANALASLDQIVGSEEGGHSISESAHNFCEDDCKLPPLPSDDGETVSVKGSSSSEDVKEVKEECEIESNDSVYDPGYESIESVLTEKEENNHTPDVGTPDTDTGYETIAEVQAASFQRGIDERKRDEVSLNTSTDTDQGKALVNGESEPPISLDNSKQILECENMIRNEPLYTPIQKTKPNAQIPVVGTEVSGEATDINCMIPTNEIHPDSKPSMLNGTEHYTNTFNPNSSFESFSPSFDNSNSNHSTSESEEISEDSSTENASPFLHCVNPDTVGENNAHEAYVQKNSLENSEEKCKQIGLEEPETLDGKVEDSLERALANLSSGNFIHNLPKPTILSNSPNFKSTVNANSSEDEIGSGRKEDNTILGSESLNSASDKTRSQTEVFGQNGFQNGSHSPLPLDTSKVSPDKSVSTSDVPNGIQMDGETDAQRDQNNFSNSSDVRNPSRNSPLSKSFEELRSIFDK